MARQWIRLYTGLPYSAKVQRLPDHLFKFLINCWTLTGASDDDCVPELDRLSFALRLDPQICQSNIDQLIDQNLLIRRQGSGKITPKNFDELQFISDSSRDRVRKHREKKKISDVKRYGNVTVTPPDSDTDQIQTQIRPDTPKPPSRRKQALSVQQAVWFESFWKGYWRRIGRGAAEKSFSESVETADQFRVVMRSMEDQYPAMMQRDSDRRPYPSTWLNQKRWKDDVDVQQAVDSRTRDDIGRQQIVMGMLERRGF